MPRLGTRFLTHATLCLRRVSCASTGVCSTVRRKPVARIVPDHSFRAHTTTASRARRWTVTQSLAENSVKCVQPDNFFGIRRTSSS